MKLPPADNETGEVKITKKTTFPLAMVVSLLSCTFWLTWYGTRLYDGVLEKIGDAQREARTARAECMSQNQFEAWREAAQELNRQANGSIVWPSIPAKGEDARYLKE